MYVFENFRIICLKIYKLDPRTKVKLDILTDIDMLLMVEKGIRGGIWHSIDVQKLATNTWKTMKKIKNSHIFSIGM